MGYNILLTGSQIRAGRALLRWTARDLADKAGIGIQTIHRAEAVDDVPSMTSRTLTKIHNAFASSGIVFDGDSGVRREDWTTEAG